MENTIENEVMNADEQELTVIERSLQEFTDAAVILRTNQRRAAKADEVGRKILAELEAAGGLMTPDFDERIKNHLVKCATAAKEMNESRKVFTQTLTIISKAFTLEEAKLDKDNAGTVAHQMQQIRNAFAAQVYREEQERQRKIKEDEARAKEAITIKSECQRRLITYVNEAINAEKTRISNAFNAITLADYDAKHTGLQNMQPAYDHAKYKAFKHGLYSNLYSAEEIDSMLVSVIAIYFEEAATNYKTQICELKQYLIDRLPSKKLELERVKQMEDEAAENARTQARLAEEAKTADAVRKKELEEQQRVNALRQKELEEEQRQQEQERIEREEEEARERDRVAAELAETQDLNLKMDESVATTMVLFDTEAALADSTIAAPETRMGFEIEALSPAAYMAMFQQWFNLDGATWTVAQLEKKLGFIKKFCEKTAFNDESKKINTSIIRYTEVFTAVNRKS